MPQSTMRGFLKRMGTGKLRQCLGRRSASKYGKNTPLRHHLFLGGRVASSSRDPFSLPRSQDALAHCYFLACHHRRFCRHLVQRTLRRAGDLRHLCANRASHSPPAHHAHRLSPRGPRIVACHRATARPPYRHLRLSSHLHPAPLAIPSHPHPPPPPPQPPPYP